ncbi:hypothetical protein NV379_02645 [Paenibacillus sp. N1-5-1-14]|uniref:hypothetical protein n=1 Tax=Paenibacillus radicibacter TaxID=2972488 RepID=UPI00215942C0|nr:hypothetical protein [Paenibacillus radicibacter]MCR8641545.1 hypothetical protein [Paenibacillus radicibacter]
MSTPNQWAIRDVATATFYEIKTGKARVQLTNLKSSGIENSGTVAYARGGSGNPKVVGFSGDRGAKIALQDCIFTNEVLAMMTGNEIKKGTVPVHQREVLKVAGDKITLTHTPAIADTLISVYKAEPDGTHGLEFTKAAAASPQASEYKVSAKVVTFKAGELTEGSEVIVYYQTKTDANSKTITVSTDKFAGTYKLVLDVLVRDVFTKEDFAAQIVAGAAKLEDGWKIEAKPDGDPSVFDIPIELLKPANSKEMYTMTIYDESALT